MANWSNPTLTSLYTDFVTEVKNRDVDLALGLDPATTSPTNVPTNAIRWNSANSRWEKYTSGSWGTLTATYALTSLSLTGSITFEGATDDAFETTLTVADPTADRTITLPNVSGTVVTTGDTGSITSTMIADGAIVNADVSASAAIAGTKISPDFGSQNVTTTGTSTAAGFIPSSATVPSNGLYLPAANQLGFSTASTSRLVVDASGNLGLGVVPSAWGASSKVFQVSQAAIESRSNGVVLANNGYYNSSGSWIYQNTSAAGLYNIAGNAHIWYTAPSGTAGGAITFTQAMTLDASGNLGIGTTAPYASLEVQGTQQTHTGVSSQVGPVAAYNTTNNADTAAVRTVLSLMRAGKSGVSYGNQANFNIGRYSQANANANTQLNLRLANGVTNDPDNDVMTWLGDGRVGIGTTSPGYTLDVANSVIQVGTSTDAFVQYKSTAGNWHVGANSSNAYVFYSGTYGSGTERARIDSSGRLLVGTDTDSGGALLQVNGDRIRVATAKTPASATATGTAGEVCWDANYIYVCTATNTWKRAAIATW